jgi:hypothetical protein
MCIRDLGSMMRGICATLAVVIGLVLTTSCGQAASDNIASIDVEGIRRECQEFCALICDRAADGSALSLWSIYVEMRQQIADRRVDFRKAVKNAMPQPPEEPAFDNENRLFGLPPLR